MCLVLVGEIMGAGILSDKIGDDKPAVLAARNDLRRRAYRSPHCLVLELTRMLRDRSGRFEYFIRGEFILLRFPWFHNVHTPSVLASDGIRLKQES
jgi:hypothetical protein